MTSGNSPPSLADRKAWRFHHACQARSHLDARSSSISIAAGGKRVSLSDAQALGCWLRASRRSSWNNGFQCWANHSIKGRMYQCTESTRSLWAMWAQRLRPSVQIWKLPQERPISGSIPWPSSGSAANEICIANRLVSPASLCHCVVMNSSQSQCRRMSDLLTRSSLCHLRRMFSGTFTQPTGYPCHTPGVVCCAQYARPSRTAYRFFPKASLLERSSAACFWSMLRGQSVPLRPDCHGSLCFGFDL